MHVHGYLSLCFLTFAVLFLSSTDGNPLPTANPNDAQELVNAIMRYKSNLAHADSNHKEAIGTLNGAKARTQKMHALAKHAQKAVSLATAMLKKKKAETNPKTKSKTARQSETELERAATRVNDVISAIQKTAEKRRLQLNQKRTSSASSSWVQGLPGLSGPLKVSCRSCFMYVLKVGA